MLEMTPDHQQPYPSKNKDAIVDFKLTSAPVDGGNDPQVVEERLKLTCKKLNEVEVNIGMFSKMAKKGVATNDVRNFVKKQAQLKHMNQSASMGLLTKSC